MSIIYHYTDTSRLPWILQSGELKPGRNKIGGFPDPDFLWATTSPLGDRTSSQNMDALRSGLTRAVRFVLHDEDFEPWPLAVGLYPTWTPEQIQRLEKFARGLSSPAKWRCRVLPLPRDRWIGIESRSYRNKQWKPLSADTELIPVTSGSDGYLSIEIEGQIFMSKQIVGPNGSAGYRVVLGQRAGHSKAA